MWKTYEIRVAVEGFYYIKMMDGIVLDADFSTYDEAVEYAEAFLRGEV